MRICATDKLVELAAPFTVDLFVEVPVLFAAPGEIPPSRNLQKRDTYLYDVELQFADCLGHHKTNCSRPNLRAHYVDIRTLPGNALGAFTNALREMAKSWGNALVRDRALSLIPAIAKLTWADLESLPKLQKQWTAVRNPLDADAIRKWFDKLKRAIRPAPFPIDASVLRETVQGYFADPETANTDVFDRLFLANALMVDLYTALRLFRTFADGTRVHRAILFMGDAHIEHLRTLFTELSFIQDPSTARSRHQCIDVRDFIERGYWRSLSE